MRSKDWQFPVDQESRGMSAPVEEGQEEAAGGLWALVVTGWVISCATLEFKCVVCDENV